MNCIILFTCLVGFIHLFNLLLGSVHLFTRLVGFKFSLGVLVFSLPALWISFFPVGTIRLCTCHYLGFTRLAVCLYDHFPRGFHSSTACCLQPVDSSSLFSRTDLSVHSRTLAYSASNFRQRCFTSEGHSMMYAMVLASWRSFTETTKHKTLFVIILKF